MDPRERFRAACIVPGTHTQEVHTVDAGRLIERLLLFEVYILESGRLLELPQFARLFGIGGLTELLRDGALRLRVEAIAHGMSNRDPDRFLHGRPQTVHAPDPEADFERHLGVLDSIPGINGSKRRTLRGLIGAAWMEPDTTPMMGALQESIQQIKSGSTSFRSALARVLFRDGHLVDPQAIRYEADQSVRGLRIETNLRDLLPLDANAAFTAVDLALHIVCNINAKLAKMKQDTALTVVPDIETDLKLLNAHLESFARPQSPDLSEAQLTRVLTLGGVPDFSAAAEAGTLDLPRFLELRRSDAARDFRRWVRESNELTDAQVRVRLDPLRERFASVAWGPIGKGLRLLATVGLGSSSLGASFATGMIDSFVLDKLLPKAGPIAFLNKDLPTCLR